MDLKMKVRDRVFAFMAAGGQQAWALGTTAVLAVAIVAYRQTQHNDSADLPNKALDRTIKLQGASNSERTGPPLLHKNSTFESYTTSYGTYPSIRVFHHPHPQAEKLPQESQPIPLLVVIHGLGGSLAQFAPLLGSLVSFAPCLGIDLPGHGLSKFDPKSWEAYSIDAMVMLVAHVIERHRKRHGYRNVVLIGHSMGSSIAALLASTTAPIPPRMQNVAGLVAICPKGTPPTKEEVWYFSKIVSLPDPLLNILRWLDKRGGINSPSVTRFVGGTAGQDLRKLQLRFNSSFPTSVWKRTAWGCLPVYDDTGQPRGGMAGREIWGGLKVPLFLIAGQSDTVTKPEEVSKIVSFLKYAPSTNAAANTGSNAIPTENSEADTSAEKGKNPQADDIQYGVQPSITESKSQHSALIKTAILPAPAAHALLYDHTTYRTLAGLIEDFLSRHVSRRLSLGWQLQQLTTSGKWDVKNLKKWQGVAPVSEPIAGGIFRGMKTLREQDEEHTPTVFAKRWSGKIYAVIDISHDSPVYDPKELEHNGIRYHKFPTVSKIPPTVEEVRDFIALVNRLRAEIAQSNASGTKSRSNLPAVAVHCHYGYNRTGFFIACYLIEKEGYRVQDAIDEFEKKRPPGIRHEHFVDTLFVQYCVGLKKAPTL